MQRNEVQCHLALLLMNLGELIERHFGAGANLGAGQAGTSRCEYVRKSVGRNARQADGQYC